MHPCVAHQGVGQRVTPLSSMSIVRSLLTPRKLLALLILTHAVAAWDGTDLVGDAEPGGADDVTTVAVKAPTGTVRVKPAACLASTCEAAVPASTFVDSIGVNVPITNARIFGDLLSLLQASGIRHVRVGICKDVVQCSFFKNLEKAGIRGTVIEDASSTASQLSTLLTNAGPLTEGAFVEALEGINEPNNLGMPWYTAGWVSHTRSQQQVLWNTVKSNPATAHVTVLGPSICCNDTDQAKLGDLSGFLDAGNMHDYFGVMNPGSIYYTGAYVIAHQRGVQAAISGSKPMVSTETGWGTKGSEPADEVNAAVQQKYVLRGFLEHRLHGLARVFDFIFADDPSAGSAFDTYGLVEVSRTGALRPKPSYVAVKNLIAALADHAGPFQATGLSFAISGDGASVDHLLLQKGDGSFDLLIWAELPGWDKSRDRPIAYPPQHVKLELSTPIASADLLAFDPGGTGGLIPSELAVTDDGVSLVVTDTPEIVHLVPTGAPTTVALPPTNPGFSLIRNGNSGQCLFVVNASLDPGTALMQNTCAEVRNQQFTVSRQPDGHVLLRDANSRNCVLAAGVVPGAAIQTAAGCSAADASQAFVLRPVGAKAYNVVASQSGLCVGVPGRSTAAGAQMQVMDCDGSASQTWSIAYTQ